MFCVTSLDHRAPASRELNSYFGANISHLNFVVQTHTKDTTFVIDPSATRFTLANGTIAKALPTLEVLATARQERSTWESKYGWSARVGPGGTLLDGLIFVPYAFDMTQVVSVTLRVGDQDMVIEGRIMTAEEKAELRRQGLEQSEPGAGPASSAPPK